MHGINAVSLLLLFFFPKYFFGQACMKKKIKPIASLVIVSWVDPGFDGGSCWENMPTVGRELDEGQSYHR